MTNIIDGLKTEDALRITEQLSQDADDLANLIDPATRNANEDIILTPKQATDLIVLIGRLTYINTGITGSLLEDAVSERMQSEFDEL
jgi:hypothetical protein